MTTVVVFHHACGVTDGVRAFADGLRGVGHEVVVADMFEGRVFDTVAAGVEHAEEVGFDTLVERGIDQAPDGEFAVVGFSLGVLPAQRLAQTRPGVLAAVLCHAAVPPAAFGPGWPDDVGLQVHLCDGDPWAEEDRAAAIELVEAARGDLCTYPGDGHLVADPSRQDHDPVIAAQILDRTIRLLDTLPDDGRRDTDGRPEPALDAGESTTLLGFLEYHRATLAWKCSGLDAAGLGQTLGPSSMTLGGLLKHMALVETNWFRRRLHGEDRRPPFDTIDWQSDPDWDWDSAAEDEPDALRHLWEDAVAHARWGIVWALALGGLDQAAAMRWPDGRAPTLRWMLAHMIEEYARHNGHADLLREAVDGATGE